MIVDSSSAATNHKDEMAGTSSFNPGDLYPGLFGAGLEDPFLTAGKLCSDDDTSLAMLSNYDWHSQPMSPLKEIPGLSGVDDDALTKALSIAAANAVAAGLHRSKTPQAPSSSYSLARSSPRLSRQRPLPNLYHALQATPQMHPLPTTFMMLSPIISTPGTGTGTTPLIGFAPMSSAPGMVAIGGTSPMLLGGNSTSAPIQPPSQSLSGADIMMTEDQSTLVTAGSMQTPDNPSGQVTGIGNAYDWMQTNRVKRRRGSTAMGITSGNSPSPLMLSTTTMVDYPPGTAFYPHQIHTTQQPHPMLYQMNQQLLNIMAQSQYPQRAPKVAMPPSSGNSPGSASARAPMMLPVDTRRRTSKPNDDSFSPESSNSTSLSDQQSTPKITTEAVPLGEGILNEWRSASQFFIQECERIDWADVTVGTLKRLLKRVSQNSSGKKEELIERVRTLEAKCREYIETDNGSDGSPVPEK